MSTSTTWPDTFDHYHDPESEREEEEHVEESLPSTPSVEIGPSSTSGGSRTRHYAKLDDEPSRSLDREVDGSTMQTGECGPTETTFENTDYAKLQQNRFPEETPSKQETEPDLNDGIDDQTIPDLKREDEDVQTDERQCRICFGGAEEEDSLGRLISPCLCMGSMRYVHVECINAWRGTGTNAKAYLECPQCHFRYRVRRTRAAGLATSRPILLLSTLVVFLSLTLILGQLLYFGLHHSPTISRSLLSSSSKSRPLASMYDLFDDGGFYGDAGGGGVVIVSGGGALMWDVLVGAVQTFVDLTNSVTSSKNRLAQSLPTPLAGAFLGLIVRFLLGLAVLGSMSFLSLLISLSLFGPLQLINGLRGAGFLGNWGRRRLRAGGGGGGGGQSTPIGTIIIVLLVIIGALNTLRQVYGAVERLTHRALRFVEAQILEVNPDEVKRERKRIRQRWWVRWVIEKRWKTREGWREVGFRIRLTAAEWWESMKRRGVGMGDDHDDVD
nr:uncharacterized protein CI109_003082 [Kwoniella shandongensis]KAA5528550.1 hypothetical protein CI109_003082 [Kwoniella shandongensis]